MAKQKLNMEPGQKYKGYGLLNEFGEFEFIPEETGSRAGSIKLVKQGDGYQLSTTKNYVVIHIKIGRGSSVMDRMREYMSIVNQVLSDLREYEF